MLKKIISFITFVFLLSAVSVQASNKQIFKNQTEFYAANPWGILFYYGKMMKGSFQQIITFSTGPSKANLVAGELSYQLAPTNIVNKFFNHIWAHVGLALNLSYQNDPCGKLYEVNPYFRLSWINFPWNKYLVTTLSFGEGVSYATRVPDREIKTESRGKNPRKFLNFLVFEAAFAAPKYPNVQIMFRLHHRSGAFKLYEPCISGSNVLAVGVRYVFG